MVLNKFKRGWPIRRVKLLEPERQAFDKSAARAEALVVIVFIVGKQLELGDVLEYRVLILPTHDTGQELCGVAVLHV